jgi:hypothetical protein
MSLVALAAVLVLTLVAAGAWVFKIPAELTGLPSLLFVIGGFAVLFFGAGLWFARKFGSRLAETGRSFAIGGDFRAQLPAMSALLPFILLVMATARLPLANPTPVFGLALLLIVLMLGLTRLLVLEWLPACALGGTLALAYTWQANHCSAEWSGVTIGWIVGFHVIFAAFPFAFRKTLADTRGPWLAAAASGALLFPAVFHLISSTWPNEMMGLLPLAFALPAFGSLVAVLRLDPPDHPRRLGRLALFGGVALLFIASGSRSVGRSKAPRCSGYFTGCRIADFRSQASRCSARSLPGWHSTPPCFPITSTAARRFSTGISTPMASPSSVCWSARISRHNRTTACSA